VGVLAAAEGKHRRHRLNWPQLQLRRGIRSRILPLSLSFQTSVVDFTRVEEETLIPCQGFRHSYVCALFRDIKIWSDGHGYGMVFGICYLPVYGVDGRCVYLYRMILLSNIHLSMSVYYARPID
jgi:hypothetical protein